MRRLALAWAVCAACGSSPSPTVVVYFARWSVPDMELLAELDDACGKRDVRCIGVDRSDPDGTPAPLGLRNVVVVDPVVAGVLGDERPPAVRVYGADWHLVGRGTTIADADRLLARAR